MDRLNEIATRKAELKVMLEGEEKVDLEEIRKELDSLEIEEKSINEQVEAEIRKQQEEVEERKIEAEKINRNEIVANEIEMKEEKNMEEMNYRTAWVKRLQGKELNEVEERAYAQSGSEGVIPVEVANEIVKKITKLVPVLDEITLFNVKGHLRFAVEGTKTDGAIHTENASISPDADTLVKVDLAGFEITKLIQVSRSVETMAVDAFEAWLVDMIAEMISGKIEDLIFNGTGSSQPKGILQEQLVETNYSTLTADNVRAWVATLPAGYDRGAIVCMNKKTLFNKFMGLQDNAKNSLIKEDGAEKYCYGYRICLSDKIADNVAVLGNFKKYVANMNMADQVQKQFDIDTNSMKYLGCAIFDGKTALTEAFVKLAPTASV